MFLQSIALIQASRIGSVTVLLYGGLEVLILNYGLCTICNLGLADVVMLVTVNQCYSIFVCRGVSFFARCFV